MALRAPERRVAAWAVQVLVPGLLAVLHPSVGGLTATGAQVLVGGSILMASGIRLRLLARGSAVLVVLAHGVAPGQLIGMLTQVHLVEQCFSGRIRRVNRCFSTFS